MHPAEIAEKRGKNDEAIAIGTDALGCRVAHK